MLQLTKMVISNSWISSQLVTAGGLISVSHSKGAKQSNFSWMKYNNFQRPWLSTEQGNPNLIAIEVLEVIRHSGVPHCFMGSHDVVKAFQCDVQLVLFVFFLHL